jgi:hypothetical protein
MPVIRGQATTTALTKERRRALLQQLKDERAGKAKPHGPVIFEIPLEQSDKMDVMVVWQEWENLRAQDRTDLIEAVYKDQQAHLALALGVTYQEAMEQQLLPYAVVPMTKRPLDQIQIREAMLAEGGIPLSEEKVDLRFPTMAMAQAATDHLCQKLPHGHWSIVQTAGPLQ